MRTAVCALLFCSAALGQAPDFIYYNGKIVTLAKERPEAQAVAIRGNRFLAVGSSAEVRKLAGPATRLVDLQGRTVLPGLNDSHAHPVMAALAERDGPVPVMRSVADVQAYVRKRAAALPADRVIFVPKVYATRLAERRYPNRYELDAAASPRPPGDRR